MEYQKLWERYNETKMYKDRWLGLYKDLYFYVIPDRNAFNVKWNFRDDGLPTTAQVWDNTAVLAAYQRSNDLHGLLLPKDRVWGKLVMDPQVFSPEQIEADLPVMDEMNERIFYYLNKSNLARVVSSSNLDLVGGTAGLWIESIDDVTPLYFRSIPAVCLYIEYSTDDVLNTCWYQCKFTGRQIRETYPNYRGIKLDALINSPNEIFIVIFGQIKLSEDKFFIYAVLEDDHDTPLWETDRSYPQIIIYRDRVRPGESDGRGIGVDMLPIIRDLNRTLAYSTQNLAFKANPPMFYDANSYFNPYMIRQWAGAMIARQPGGGNPLEALKMPDYPEVWQWIKDSREFVIKGFMIDPLGEINSPVRSATEISIRENRAQRSASTDISRLINELPRQIYEVSAKILSERRLLTRDRQVALKTTRNLGFAYQTPLYDLQKQDNLNHMVTMFQVMQQFFGAGAPMMISKLPEVKNHVRDWLNLPADMMVSDQQLMDYIQQAAQVAQQAQLPQPTTGAAKVTLPPERGVTV